MATEPRPRRRPLYEYLIAYGGALAVPPLFFLLLPDDRSWALPLIVLGVLMVAVGLVLMRLSKARADQPRER